MIPFVLIPGLNCDARVYAGVVPTLWQFGPVTVASTLEGDGVAGIAASILASAPQHFALAGFSMGGYLAFEIMRQAPGRVLRLALIDTAAPPDAPETTAVRRRRIEHAEARKFGLVIEQSFPTSVHPDNESDSGLYAMHRAMAEANGPEIYVRHQQAIIARPDSRPGLAAIAVPTVVIVGEGDRITTPEQAEAMHRGIAGSRLVTIPRAGHLTLLEQPPLVAAALKEWASGPA
jgi:pimeloyl-ACP methyl ester carboxylesterase